MAHFVRTQPDGTWVSGYVVQPDDFKDATRGLDVKTFKAINGDDGGTWTPSAPIIIGGFGLRVTGPLLVSNSGVIQTVSGSGARITLGDGDYPQLAIGHTGRSFTRANGSECAFSTLPMIVTGSGGATSTALGQIFTIPITQLHDGSTVTTVTFNFKVGTTHPSVPAILPRMRVVRMSANGDLAPMKSVGSGADINGYVTVTTPVSGAAWYNGGAAKTFVYTCDQNNVIDKSQYVYFLVIVDEDGSGAIVGNTWLPTLFLCTNITDLRPG